MNKNLAYGIALAIIVLVLGTVLLGYEFLIYIIIGVVLALLSSLLKTKKQRKKDI